MTSKWAWWRLKSPTSRLFTQSFIQTQIKENIKALCHWPLCGEFTSDWWIPRTNDQLRGKCFHLMKSSWEVFKVSICEMSLQNTSLVSQGLVSNEILFFNFILLPICIHHMILIVHIIIPQVTVIFYPSFWLVVGIAKAIGLPLTIIEFLLTRYGILVQLMVCYIFSTMLLLESMVTYCQLDPWEQLHCNFNWNISFDKRWIKCWLQNDIHLVK